MSSSAAWRARSWCACKLQNGKVVGEEWLLQDRGRRIRDVKQGPDGAIYIVTEAADGELLKISRKS